MNINPNIEESAAQRRRILAWFLAGHTLTQWEASDKDNPMRWDCTNLSARISELREAGWIITTTWESHTKHLENGKTVTKRYVRYSIAPEDRKQKEASHEEN